MNKSPKIIFIDFNFSWLPNGGADVDTYNVLKHLYEKGYNVLFVGIAEESSSDRGKFDPKNLPFPSTRISIPSSKWNPDFISQKIISLIKEHNPSIIFLQHGYHIKIPISKSITDHFPDIPVVSRAFAHELFCLRSPLRFKEGRHCPKNIVETPDTCRRCSLEGLKNELLSGTYTSWTKDYIQSKSFSWSYMNSFINTLKMWKKVIVYNRDLQSELEKHGIDTIVIPGGIEPELLNQEGSDNSEARNEKIIFMAGRCDEPSKGMFFLYEAGKILYQNRKDFKILATSFNLNLFNDWFVPLGWLSRAELFQKYREVDICVIPSIWAEPFGITALEGMAFCKPVVASRIGGLKEIISDNQTGVLFEPGNPQQLAEKLNLLLDNPQFGNTLGKNAKQHVQQNYAWDKIIDMYYIPLLEDLLSREKNKL